MKRGLLAIAAALMFGGQAGAQSNVTIYGVIDAYGQVLHGAARSARLQSGGMNGSRLGFRGSEDLGDGFKALFTLELGFSSDTGSLNQGGAIFGRQAFVGLGGAWGELTLGRQMGSLYRLGQSFVPFGMSGAGPTAPTIGGFAGGYEPFRGSSSTSVPPAAGVTANGGPPRIDNSIRFASPTWGGLQGMAVVGLGEVAGNTQGNRIVDLSLRYTVAPFDAYVLYVSDRTDSAASPGDVATTGLGGIYRIGSYRLFAGGIDVDDRRAANLDGRGYWFGADYTLGRHLLRGQWLRSEPRSGSDNETTAFGVGYQYNFTKRTALYSSLTRFDNGRNAGVGGLGRFNSAMPAGVTRPGDNNLSEFVAGMQHRF